MENLNIKNFALLLAIFLGATPAQSATFYDGNEGTQSRHHSRKHHQHSDHHHHYSRSPSHHHHSDEHRSRSPHHHEYRIKVSAITPLKELFPADKWKLKIISGNSAQFFFGSKRITITTNPHEKEASLADLNRREIGEIAKAIKLYKNIRAFEGHKKLIEDSMDDLVEKLFRH